MKSETITTPEECPGFNTCSANLCPYDKKLEDRIWYPDEAVCVRQNMIEEFPWIKIQKRIAKKCRDRDKYFTLEMLKNLSGVRKGTIGLNPDISHQRQLNSWLKDHHKAKKREYTEEERRAFREKMVKGKKIKDSNPATQIEFKF